MCDAVYIGNIQEKFNKIMGGYFYDLQLILKNGHKLDSFAVYYEQHFKSTNPCTELRKCMVFKLVQHIYPIVSIK